MTGSIHPQSHSPSSPDQLYACRPPWDIGRPQPAFRQLADTGDIRGRVLDVGCGTGEHVLMAASLGLDATGVDLAETALRAAKEKARARSLTAEFRLHDARRLGDLGRTFDTVRDCGLFHIFGADDRAVFAESLRAAVEPGGRYFMLCFSDRETRGDWSHVHRVRRDEIVAAFADGWRIDAIEPAVIEIIPDPDGIHAWLSVLTRS